MATLIASQAVISGAFSLTRQAIQLNFLPRLLVRQTSAKYIGQIYLPFINGLLLLLVALVVVFFGSSERLAGAYGVAVSGTLVVDSLLFMVIARHFWQRSKAYVAGYGVVFLSLDLVLAGATLSKIRHGGWVPLLIAVSVLTIIYTWATGQRVAAKTRQAMEPPLREFITEVQAHDQSLVRLPGQAVYIGHHIGLTPTALRVAVEELHELHDKAVIVYVKTAAAAHVPPKERTEFDELGYADGISMVTITYGFHDSPNVPKTLESLRRLSPELNFDPYQAVYFISLSRIVASRRHTMPGWQKKLYALMAQNALSTSDYYRLSTENTIEMRALIKV
jgi:KUP system potassium uptake protein